ncbi:hypothetical protein [Rugamonas sp. DEMB1]|uniref:hypothetical protein n=1 Tax=Rugamonas sp. DEMB1 TaxID=3039386 RepID=UPI00244BFD6D|nr:hypothetical protein [Rugamonas sp. DEMB1]WGG51653.1 hypothetical protein QC826_05275 [Rugamonas sp. DEMB1]
MKSKPHSCCADCADGREQQAHGAHEAQAQDQHRQLATEQAALHLASLALARWRAGNTPVELSVATTLAPHQTQWHANTQRNFCAWLAAGGFAARPPEHVEGLESLASPGNPADLAGAKPAQQANKALLRKPAPPELSCIDGA